MTNDAMIQKLLAPFKPNEIGKLPRITCPDCSKERSRCCGKHTKSRCKDCGNYITEKHIHLDYVGHADVTRRLLEVDPLWTWEPAAEEGGLPLLDRDADGNPVGLWIRLTVAGVTRLGYGSCPSNQSDAVKVLIGDALRNGALRFGVALDLWAKGDRSDPSAENAVSAPATAARRPATPVMETGAGQIRAQIGQLCKEHSWDIQKVAADYKSAHKMDIAHGDVTDLQAFLFQLREEAKLEGEAAS